MSIEMQERYSSLVDAKLRYSIVQRNGAIWNNRYEGSPKAGAVKIPVRDTEAKVSAYDKANGIKGQLAEGSFLTVTIDKDYAVNEILDGYEASAVPDNIVADRLDSAGYSLALKMNDDATEALYEGGTVESSATALTKNTIYEVFVDARKSLSKAKVPVNGRFALVSPDTFALLLKSPEFISASNLGDEVKESGAVGQIAGFTVYEDATLTSVNGAIDFICGHPDWCHRIEEWAVEPKVVSLDNSGSYIGASAVQGRKVYAHKVSKKEAVIVHCTSGGGVD